MFVLTTLVYPVVLALLCIAAALLVDRLCGWEMPAVLLPVVGAATLIAVSQLSTYASPLAPATPYLMLVVALAGIAVGRGRARALVQRLRTARTSWWQLLAPVLAYVLGLAPVLLAGRPSFSSYQTLSDSAFHMMGADFLIRHGQDYTHLDLRNSYGEYVRDYYGAGYPSGADTLFGGSAFLLGLPLIWAFQPFNAFLLATAAGPAWLLLRRIGLTRGLAVLGALTVTVPALVYGYELIGSVKEIASVGMVLSLGALVAVHPLWVHGRAAAATPFALVAAAGISSLGVGFGAWVAGTAVVLAVVLVGVGAAGARERLRALRLIGFGIGVGLVAALPTWAHLPSALEVTNSIADTSGPGNLITPLKATQVFGAWVSDSYRHPPTGGDLTATTVLIAITAVLCVLGALRVLRRREYALAGWLALMLIVWGAISAYSTTWVSAKTVMLTTPVIVLMAWGGVAALRASRRLWLTAPVLALVLLGGAVASDATQYHAANLAPTVRYEELESIDHRFAGQGPALFTDFDEYSLYTLRDLDVGGPSFIYGPPALVGPGASYRHPVQLDRLPPQALRAYRLIITRRDPELSRPPAAYTLAWQGTYYEVWRRTKGAPAALATFALTGTPRQQCATIGYAASLARGRRAELVAARAPQLVRVELRHATRPRRWGHIRGGGLVMSTAGTVSAPFTVQRAGAWEVWLEGQVMPTIKVSVDGGRPTSIGAQLGGNSVVLNAMTPVPVSLAAGVHVLSISRGGFTPAPGEGGYAYLYRVFLAPAGAAGGQPLRVASRAAWRSLCGRSYRWVEVLPRG
jgi:hypothetical protein